MKSENFMLTVAIITMLISALSLGFTYFSVNSFKQNILTGYTITTNGTIYINITSQESFNLSTATINWGVGRVNASDVQAFLDTSQNSVVNGTWTPVSSGFVLENTGNVNLSISIKSGKVASTFIGGTNPVYQMNVTSNEASSCINVTGYNLSFYVDVNNTGGWSVCSNLSYIDTADTIKVDVRLIVPYNSITGNLSDQFQFTGTQSA